MSLLFADMADIIVRKSKSLTLQGEQLKVFSLFATLISKAYTGVKCPIAMLYDLLISMANNAIQRST